MATSLISAEQISFLLVLSEGLLSFFSPCVIPLIPIYMSYLAGNAKQTAEDGTITYQRGKVFFNTVFFVLGISFAFYILGLSFTLLGSFFQSNQLLFTRIGGILILLLGLVQVGFLDLKFLQKERKFHLKLGNSSINPLLAFFMGFTFSFAWTPCVGPALSSVLILASSSGDKVIGNLLVLVYTIGFIVPFLLLGLFTTKVLNFLSKQKKLLKYTVKIGGVILILIGIMTFTGWMNGISSYLNSFTPQKNEQSTTPKEDNTNSTNEELPSSDPADDYNNSEDNSNQAAKEEKQEVTPAYDFTLIDQYGNSHTLSDYKGKVVFLNFWATWCPPCKKEMPDIQFLYEKYGKNSGEVIILGVANPVSDEYLNNSDIKKEEIISFLEDNSYTFPVVFDETGDLLANYYISAFPTTFMIDADGNVFGYVPGMMNSDTMENIIQKTLDAVRK